MTKGQTDRSENKQDYQKQLMTAWSRLKRILLKDVKQLTQQPTPVRDCEGRNGTQWHCRFLENYLCSCSVIGLLQTNHQSFLKRPVFYCQARKPIPPWTRNFLMLPETVSRHVSRLPCSYGNVSYPVSTKH